MSKYGIPQVEAHDGSSFDDEDEESSLKEIGERKAFESSEKQEEYATEEDDDFSTEEEEEGGGGGIDLQSKLKMSHISMAKSATRSLKRQLSGKNSMFGLKRVKRGIEDGDGNVEEEKKKKKSDKLKKVLFERLWSEDDEIDLLNGMIEYNKKTGLEELNDFFDFIKNSLHVNVRKAQLSDKIRRLKKKYKNNARKAEAGKLPMFWKAHEKKSYELSKKLWGWEEGEKELATLDRVVVKEEKKSDKVGYSPCGSNSNSNLNMDEKQKKLEVRQLELFLEELNLKIKRTELALEVMKSS
ncbi:probable transcription factor At1g11510 [Diospyros lotus]|uniref:probable transcription factor At1g11510 n=1 Tax=Diospyros lotus TaxID=55363 RepID=UPI00225BDD2C|nr:probable transcription factor At1g11510 [Diospyros lotus]XP_052208060.1 probable transcription factor At1g11510 [Diospyros lotus]